MQQPPPTVSSLESAAEFFPEQILNHLENLPGAEDQTIHRLLQEMIYQLKQKRAHGVCGSTNLDPVLRVALNKLRGNEQSDTSNAIRNLAVRNLAGNLEAYQELIGEFLPPWLVEQANILARRNAYDRGVNSNADEDQEEFFFRFSRPDLNCRFPLGINHIDHSLNGGIGGLTVLLGDKGVGKTALTINCMFSVLEEPDTCVLFYSLDMPKQKIYERIWSRELGVPHRELEQALQNHGEYEERISATRAKLERVKVIERDYSDTENPFDETVELSGLSARSVFDTAIDLVRVTGARKLLIVVDLLQKIIVPGSATSSAEDIYRLDLFDELNQKLLKYFGGNKFAFLITSEMRKRDGRRLAQRPTIDDIKGDGRIASDADAILILSPNREDETQGQALNLEIAKGREGVVRGNHSLMFRHLIGRFDERHLETQVSSETESETIYEE